MTRMLYAFFTASSSHKNSKTKSTEVTLTHFTESKATDSNQLKFNYQAQIESKSVTVEVIKI